MMSESMVERVDKAIEAAGKAWLASRPVYEGWADVPGDVLARAAIEALREPTEAMIEARKRRQATGTSLPYEQIIAAEFTAMIDAALTPSPASK